MDGVLDAGVEVRACSPFLVERVERFDIRGRHGAAECAVRQRGQNGARTGAFLRRPCGTTDEDLAPAWRVPPADGVVGSADNELVDLRGSRRQVEALEARAVQPEVHRRRHWRAATATGATTAAAASRGFALCLEILTRRRHAHRVQSSLHRHAHLIRIGSSLITASQDAEKSHLEHIFSVDGKIMLHGHAGAGIERQVLVQLLVPAPLEQVAFGVIDLFAGLQREIAHGKAADLARGGHVTVQQRGRGGQHRRDIVEAVSGIVHRQPFAGPDVHGQQVPNGIAVLGAIEAMNRRPARIRMRRSRPVQHGLQICGERARGLRIRTRTHRRRWHLSSSHFPHDLFPHFRVCRHIHEFQRLERKARGFQPIVVTRDTVSSDELGVFRCRGRGRLHRLHLCGGGDSASCRVQGSARCRAPDVFV